MKNHQNERIDLSEIAFDVVHGIGFHPEFSIDAVQQLNQINDPAKPTLPNNRDLRDKLWISIDNDDSLDLDQITFVDKNRVYVAIADVDALVAKGTPIDQHAAENTTSVYTPTRIFPMLPPKLSTNLTSLNENCDRCAIVIESTVEDSGKFKLEAIYPAYVRNKAKLTYNGVSAWLEKGDFEKPLKEVPGLSEQILRHDQLAQAIKKNRIDRGALQFASMENKAILENGVPVEIKPIKSNRATEIIENFMIISNAGLATFLKSKKVPVVSRIVKQPKSWDRIVALANELGEELPREPDAQALQEFLARQLFANPVSFPDLSLAIIKLIGKGEYVVEFPGAISEGHFDLALAQYAHTTAPNRRFPDLIMQRLLKSVWTNSSIPYSNDELVVLAQRCTEKEGAATKVERRVRKSAAAIVLASQIGSIYDAIVTGASEKDTWVRLISNQIEGKLAQGFSGVDVGDLVKVKLIHVDIRRGFIDFSRVNID